MKGEIRGPALPGNARQGAARRSRRGWSIRDLFRDGQGCFRRLLHRADEGHQESGPDPDADPNTAVIYPFFEEPTVRSALRVIEPPTMQASERRPALAFAKRA